MEYIVRKVKFPVCACSGVEALVKVCFEEKSDSVWEPATKESHPEAYAYIYRDHRLFPCACYAEEPLTGKPHDSIKCQSMDRCSSKFMCCNGKFGEVTTSETVEVSVDFWVK